jgi:hypothetical protein
VNVDYCLQKDLGTCQNQYVSVRYFREAAGVGSEID